MLAHLRMLPLRNTDRKDLVQIIQIEEEKINFRGLFNALKVNFYPFAPCKNLHLPNKALVCYYIIKSVLMYIVHCTGALVVVGSPGR